MDEIFQNLKQKIPIDNIVEFMKEAQLISDDKLKEEEVRETLQKIDSSKIGSVDELTAKLSNIGRKSKSTIEEVKSRSKSGLTSTKTSSSVLQKPTDQRDLTEEEEMARHENIIAFYN